MDFEEDLRYDSDSLDSGNESSDVEDDVGLDTEPCAGLDKMEMEEFPSEVLTTEQIVQHMIDCIKEVNNVVEVTMTD